VILKGQASPKGIEIDFQRLDTARIVFSQGRHPTHQMERGPLFGARLSQEKRTGEKLKGRQVTSSPGSRALLFLVETSGSHQVKDQKDISLQFNDHPLAHTGRAHRLEALHQFRPR